MRTSGIHFMHVAHFCNPGNHAGAFRDYPRTDKDGDAKAFDCADQTGKSAFVEIRLQLVNQRQQ